MKEGISVLLAPTWEHALEVSNPALSIEADPATVNDHSEGCAIC